MIGQITGASLTSFSADFYSRRNREDEQAFNLEKRDEKKANERKDEKLTPAEKEQVQKLKQRDAEVRRHEQAHMAAAGSLAMGGPSYTYQTGPDGKNYAIGGSVKIDTSPGNTPEETIRKAAQIKAAALAPDDPSGQDLKVAAAASSLATEAQAKISKGEGKEEPGRVQNDKNHTDGAVSSSHQLLPSGEVDSENEDSERSESGYGKSLAELIAEKYGNKSQAKNATFQAVA